MPVSVPSLRSRTIRTCNEPRRPALLLSKQASNGHLQPSQASSSLPNENHAVKLHSKAMLVARSLLKALSSLYMLAMSFFKRNQSIRYRPWWLWQAEHAGRRSCHTLADQVLWEWVSYWPQSNLSRRTYGWSKCEKWGGGLCRRSHDECWSGWCRSYPRVPWTHWAAPYLFL